MCSRSYQLLLNPCSPRSPALGIRLLLYRKVIRQFTAGALREHLRVRCQSTATSSFLWQWILWEFLHLLLVPLRAAVNFRKASVNGKKTWIPKDVTLWFTAGARNTSWQRKSRYFWTHSNSTPTGRIPNSRALSHQHNVTIWGYVIKM